MNYDQARQKQSDGKWHYTSRNGNHVHAIGYCSPRKLCPDCPAALPRADCKTCGGRGLIDCENPCPGHDTAEEAEEHYRQYLLDNATYRGGGDDPDTLHRCEAEGCTAHTAGSAQVGWGVPRYYHLCDAHRNRETLDKLVERPGVCIHS